MNDEVYVVTAGRMFVNGKTLTQKEIESGIDDVLKGLDKTGDTTEIDNAIITLMSMQKYSFFYLCKILYEYNLWWVRTGQEEKRGDAFEDYIESVHGLNRTVMARYVNIWHKRSTGELPESITSRPLKDQYAIADVLDGGYEITEEQWEELEEAKNNNEVHAILRKVKGKEPTKASFIGYLERTGDVVYWHQEQRFHCGFLKRPDDAIDELERKVLEKVWSRAENGMGLIKR